MNVGDRVRITRYGVGTFEWPIGCSGVITRLPNPERPHTPYYNVELCPEHRRPNRDKFWLCTASELEPVPAEVPCHYEPSEGGEHMENITINGKTYRLVEVTESAAALNILHPWAVYRLDGTRLDGYADRERAIRRGNKFLGRNGFYLVNMNEASTEFVPASR